MISLGPPAKTMPPGSAARRTNSGLPPGLSQILSRCSNRGTISAIVEWPQPVWAVPGDAVVVVGGDEQVELGAVQQIVVAHVEIEQRKR